MSRVIRIPESIFERLQHLAAPLVDTPASVIERLLDYYDSQEKGSVDEVKKPKVPKDPSDRSPRDRGVVVEVEGRPFRADTLADLYRQILEFICDNGYMKKLEKSLPLRTSRFRYLIATDPTHPSKKKFYQPVEYRGYYMETNKDYKNGINHLRKMLKVCGLSLNYLGGLEV